ncbi:DUF4876 domain-containing protein [Pedobacter yulinensis]|uniref:DUF4876 domain-containing protein n=1 Tax=Pedobacter yulinensis TaxID=2126353 RepID=A0A2T3HL89_9SPHI|nr:DUF4876 domain-containing protein [Pedobacter yulinensis]PST83194.1 DUF4876 domain-containing protein [Pedobacter yulinensis]
MKKNLFFLLLLTAVFAACKKDRSGDVQPVKLSVKLQVESNAVAYGFDVAKTKVTVQNIDNGQSFAAQADATGLVEIDNLMPGAYDIQASLTIAAAEYTQATGISTTQDIVYNASAKAQSLINLQNSLVLELQTGTIGDWVMKQIYYAGSNGRDGASFRDCFVEIYNNSNKVLYADSLCFGQAHGIPTKKTAIDFTKPYILPSGQFDWTKAVGMNNARANSDYIYASSMFMIPGTGKQHPVQPGSSIIIAATALNHKGAYIGSTGTQITVRDPELTVDLSKADFEVYVGDQPGVNPLNSDVNNPSVPNLTVILRGDRDLIFDATGRDSYFLVKTPQDVASFGKFAAPDITNVTASTKLYVQIPVSVVLDAVEVQPPLSDNQFPQRLQASLDAGFTFVSKGQYSSQSLIRKTARTVAGRRVLQDTNNSKNDFTELDRADPSKTAFK